MLFKQLWFTVILVNCVDSKMEKFVIGGQYASIASYPHQLYIEIYGDEPSVCGGSILNQAIILTAAHCLTDIDGKNRREKVVVNYGSAITSSFLKTYLTAYKVHESYSFVTMYGDIALGVCKTGIQLGRLVKRVAIMENPPIRIMAYFSGFGAFNENLEISTKLIETDQLIRPPSACLKLGNPKGTFCAGPITGPGRPAIGDSGGALIIDKYIQIGLASYNVKGYSLVAYTNVSYYYPWIMRHSARLFCHHKLSNVLS